MMTFKEIKGVLHSRYRIDTAMASELAKSFIEDFRFECAWARSMKNPRPYNFLRDEESFNRHLQELEDYDPGIQNVKNGDY